MTTTPSSIRTTIQIRRGANTALSTSYDFTGLGILTNSTEKLRYLIDQAILQWWSSLTSSQKSEPNARELNLLISGRYQREA